jgi:hypothetical protein
LLGGLTSFQSGYLTGRGVDFMRTSGEQDGGECEQGKMTCSLLRTC